MLHTPEAGMQVLSLCLKVFILKLLHQVVVGFFLVLSCFVWGFFCFVWQYREVKVSHCIFLPPKDFIFYMLGKA